MAKLPHFVFNPPKLSNFDLTAFRRFTLSPGTLNIAYTRYMTPGDDFVIKPQHKLMTMPLKAPLYGTTALQTDWFFVPLRLYNTDMQANTRTLPDADSPYQDYKLPWINLDGAFMNNAPIGGEADSLEKNSVAPSSIFNQVEFPIGYYNAYNVGMYVGKGSVLNCVPYLGYLDIFRNYYSNSQEDDFYFIGPNERSAADVALVYDNKPTIMSYKMSDLDDFFDNKRWNTGHQLTALMNIFFAGTASTRKGGQILRCYKPDYFSNFLNKKAYDAMQNGYGFIVTSQNESTGNNGFTVNQLRLGNRLEKMAEKLLATNGRFSEFIRATSGVSTRIDLLIPEYLGGYTQYMDYQTVTNVAGGSGSSARDQLGGMASRGQSYGYGRNVYVRPSEPGYLMCITSIVPMPDYSQGRRRESSYTHISDFYIPDLDRVGYQPLFMSELCALTPEALGYGDYNISQYPWQSEDGDIFSQAVGYHPAWFDYMTDTNRCFGDLGYGGSLDFWTMNRDFVRPTVLNADEADFGTPDTVDVMPSAYIFPSDWTGPFVDSSATAENYILQYKFDIFARRPMSKKLAPAMGV